MMQPAEAPLTAKRHRVLSGFRPTGPMHIGHLVGALENWIKMQDTHDCFFAICDWHALTSDYADTRSLKDNILAMAVDWLAAGLDPNKCVLFIQSSVPEHAELHLLLSMIVPLPWLERVPTYKEQQQQLMQRDLSNYGFLGYPVLQAADILIYRANVVPVGEDQLAHLELCREIARRFNSLYGAVFPEPETFDLRRADKSKTLSFGKGIHYCLGAALGKLEAHIALEALTNVARHAQARTCHVRLSLSDTQAVSSALTLAVIDDGRGLPLHTHAGVGMSSMRERAAELGGTCDIESSATGGTHVLVRFPLPKE